MSVNTSELGAQDVDILWVIDNSGSMADKQAAVRDNSAQFMAAFTSSTRLRWRMGLISTDVSQSPYFGFKPIVDWTTSGAIGAFNQAVSLLGTGGSSTEQAYDPTLKHLRAFPNFLRPGAFFVMIVVTDEEEQSQINTLNFLKELKQLLGGSERFAAFTVVEPALSGGRYTELVGLTKGKSYNIRSPDYGVLLAELGKDLVQRVMQVNPVILLDQRPKAETIQVVYKGRILAPGQQWTYDPEFNLVRITDQLLVDSVHLNVRVSFELAD